jgi:hypothetical protein
VSDWADVIRSLVNKAMADARRQADGLGATELRYEGLAVAEDGTVTVTFLAGVPVDGTVTEDNDQGGRS